MRVLISGGGIAGLTAAYWLEQFGFTPIVVERAPAVRHSGYGIDFFGTGYDVAERMNIISALAARQLRTNALAMVNSDDQVLAKLHVDAMRRALNNKYMPLMHYTLEQVLYDAVRERVEVRLGNSIQSVSQTDKQVQVTFERGAPEAFDLLIGADGIHSNVRALVFGPEENFSHYMGYYLASYMIPHGLDDQLWKLYPEAKRQAAIYSSERPHEAVAFFIWEQPDEGTLPREKRLQRLHEKFDDAGWITGQMLAYANETTDIFADSVTQIRMKGWSRGRIVLTGDACDCLTLISGQGASMAMGSSYILAQELQRNENYSDAFAYYENRMRPQVELRQEKAKALAKTFVPDSATALVWQRLLMQVLMRDQFASFLEQQLIGSSILQTETLHRLDARGKNVLAYRVAGKMELLDYARLQLDMQYALSKQPTVRLLLQLDDLQGAALSALRADATFGREFHSAIEKLAVVGDTRLAALAGNFSTPFYARAAQHFQSADMDAAYAWLAE